MSTVPETEALTISIEADGSPPTCTSIASTTDVTTVPGTLGMRGASEAASACMASWFDASMVSRSGVSSMSRCRVAERSCATVVLTVVW